MPSYTSETPTIERKFYDITFQVPAPFAAGHTLTANEANWMNSNVASVIGNAYSGDIRRAMQAHNEAALKAHTEAGGKAKDFKPAEDVSVLGWDHAAKFAEKYAGYELGVTSRGGGSGEGSSPLSRTIMFLAAEDLKARMVRKGLKVANFYKAAAQDGTKFKSRWAELLAQNIEAKRDEFTETATAMLAKAEDDAEDDLLSGEVPADDTSEVAAAAE
jgi:hypothetical protein